MPEQPGLGAVVALAVTFRLLGEPEAEVDGRPTALGHARQRCVLAVLLLEANRPVSVDQLVDRVWEDQLPQRARDTVYGYLSRLRRLLATGGVGIVRRSGGYALAIDPMTVDLYRFRRLVAEARAARDNVNAADRFGQALGLWRGEAFAGLHTAWLDGVRVEVDQERLAAELDRNDVVLDLGRHAELLANLSAGVAKSPLDERLAGQLMVALYRDSRPAEALRCYERLRRLLIDELGADPGPRLQQLHRQVLTADPALAGPPPALAAGKRAPVPQQLPAPPRRFTGRTSQLTELSNALGTPPARGGAMAISAIGGTGGIGKTWLVLQWASSNLHRFPDGQLYVNLRGFDPTGEPVPAAVALRGFLDALGVESAAVPVDVAAQAALYRSLTAGRRLLIVLDNARDTAQVAPLLPGTSACTVLVTSRHSLAGLVTEHGARPMVLDVLTDSDARRLLEHQLGRERVDAEPAAVSTLVRHCAGLPLALGVVAARAALQPELPLAVLAKELHDQPTRLDALDAGELAANLRSVLACSYRALGDEAARAFGCLGFMPGPDIGLGAAASLLGLPIARTRALLRELGNAHLVSEHMPERYRMHDLVRLYASEQATAAGRPALHRVLDHYLHTAYAADRMLDPHREQLAVDPVPPGVGPEPVPDHAAALGWFTAEHRVLVAAVAYAAGAGCEPRAWRLAWALKTFFDTRGHWHDQAATQRTALRAARRLADLTAQAHAHRGLGLAYIWLHRFDEAGTQLRHALVRFGELGDPTGQAHAHRGLARLLAQQGRHRDALAHDEQALSLHQAAGNRIGQAIALNAVGWHRAHLGDHQPALAHCQRALGLYQRLGDRRGQAATWDSLGYIRRQLGQHRQAIDCYRRALALFREIGDRYFEGEVLASLGDAHHADGAPDAACLSWRQALRILDELGHHTAERVRATLRRHDHPAG